MRKIYDRYNYIPRKPEKISFVDEVDRSGYIPLDVQYARMMAAGAQLEMTRDYLYNVDIEKLNKAMNDGLEIDIEKLSNSSISGNKLDRTELDGILKEKYQQYKQYKSKQEELKTLLDKYKQLENEKKIRQDAINQYKEQLYKEKVDSTFNT